MRFTPQQVMKVLGGGGWSPPRFGRFTPWKETWYPLYRRLGGPHGQTGQVWKILPPSGFDPQCPARSYTDSAIPVPHDGLLSVSFLVPLIMS
jgi:hypothetical protein